MLAFFVHLLYYNRMKSGSREAFCNSHAIRTAESFRPWQTIRVLEDVDRNLVDRSTANWILDHQVVPGEILPPSQGETVHIIACPTEQKPYDWAQEEPDEKPHLYDWSKDCPEPMDKQASPEQQRPVSMGMTTVLGRSAMWPVAMFLNGLTPKDM